MHEYADKDFSKYDCFICVLMSHGGESHIIYGTDDIPNSINSLIKPFKDCKTMRGKPKLFIVQACRGNDDEIRSKQELNNSNVNLMLNDRNRLNFEIPSFKIHQKIPIEADVLIYYSTPNGYISWRHPDAGSWFISCFCQIFNNNAMQANIELNQLLIRVNNLVALKHKQMPEIVSRLRKEFYFNFNASTTTLKSSFDIGSVNGSVNNELAIFNKNKTDDLDTSMSIYVLKKWRPKNKLKPQVSVSSLQTLMGKVLLSSISCTSLGKVAAATDDEQIYSF